MIKFIKSLFCDHEYDVYGCTYVECKKCKRKWRNEDMNIAIMNNTIETMVNKGLWDISAYWKIRPIKGNKYIKNEYWIKRLGLKKEVDNEWKV